MELDLQPSSHQKEVSVNRKEYASDGIAGGIVRGLGAKLAVLPLSALASIASARLLTEQVSIEAFAWFALVAGLPLLLPFADFGMGASLASAGALATDSPNKAAEFRALLRRATLYASLVSFLLSGASIALSVLGAWTSLLGIEEQDLNLPIGIAMTFFALSIPGALGYSVLLGIGRNGLAVILQGLTPVASLVVLLAAVVLEPTPTLVVSVACTGIFISSWISYFTALKHMPRSPDTVRAQRAGRLRILTTAAPMMLLMASGAVYLHSGRLVVSNLGDSADLANFAAAWLVFQPLWSVVQTAARSLWPHFTRNRASGRDRPRDFAKAVAIMAAIGAAAGGALLVFGPWVSALATAGQTQPSLSFFALLAILLVVQSVVAPAGMYFTSPIGLWAQVAMSASSAVLAVSLSITFFPSSGDAGVGIGLVLGALLCQLIPLNAAAWLSFAKKSQGRDA